VVRPVPLTRAAPDGTERARMSGIVHRAIDVECMYVSDRLPVMQPSRGAWPVASNASAEPARGNIQPRPRGGATRQPNDRHPSHSASEQRRRKGLLLIEGPS
jgi:hypothetical protein